MHLGCLHTSSSGFGCSESVCLAEKSIPGSPVKGEKKKSLDPTDLPPPLKVLSKVRDEFAVGRDLFKALITNKTKQDKAANIGFLSPPQGGNTWMNERNPHGCY